MARGFSAEARKKAAIARKIKNRLGMSAYRLYKENGIIPAGLDAEETHAKDQRVLPKIRPEIKKARTVSFTASRRLNEHGRAVIDSVLAEMPKLERINVGGAVGGDAYIAKRVKEIRPDVHVHLIRPGHREEGKYDFEAEEFADSISTAPKGETPAESYHNRNAALVKTGEVMIAFPNAPESDARRSGTWSTARRAKEAGKPTQEFLTTSRIPVSREYNPPKAEPEHQTEAEVSQAEVRPDTSPTHQEPATPSDFLKELHPGEIVRDSKGQRIRVQKRIFGGLRIHDNKLGARDLNWKQLEALGLKREEREEGGPAAQRIGELREEAIGMGIDVSGLYTKRDLEEAIGKKLDEKEKGESLDQIEPMLASDAKELQDYSADQPWRSLRLMREFWMNPNWVAEEKLDGVRLKLHFTEDGVRVDSRRRDKTTRRFSEKSANFTHMLALDIPELRGTVLDSEGMIPAEEGDLPSGVHFKGSLAVSTAATNAGSAVSRQIQNQFGPMQFWVFDILRFQGKDVSQLPYEERYKLLKKVIDKIHEERPATKDIIHIPKRAEGDDKLPFFEDIIKHGGEGIIFKRLDHTYQEGKRAKSWQKLKKFQEVDAVVKGYVPGKAGNEGLVGALELAVRIDGKWVPIAAVSQLTLEQQKEMSNPDGSLKKEFYGQVVTFRGQELTKKGRFRHAVFVSFRQDKDPNEVDGYEVRKDLEKLGVI